MVKYEGLFFEDKDVELIHSLEEGRLDTINDEIHCTFKYRPSDEEIFNDIVGKSYEIELIGYGSNGMNSGFLVKLPEELNNYYLSDARPHITASLADGAKGNDTKDLNFKRLDKTYKINGRFGYWIMDDDGKEYKSFNKYTISKS